MRKLSNICGAYFDVHSVIAVYEHVVEARGVSFFGNPIVKYDVRGTVALLNDGLKVFIDENPPDVVMQRIEDEKKVILQEQREQEDQKEEQIEQKLTALTSLLRKSQNKTRFFQDIAARFLSEETKKQAPAIVKTNAYKYAITVLKKPLTLKDLVSDNA